MSNRKSKVDNGYLAAVTNAHIGEALDAHRQDLEEHPSSGEHGRVRPLRLLVEAWGRVVTYLNKFRKHGPKPGS